MRSTSIPESAELTRLNLPPARARNIEVRLEYAEKQLRLLVRDDGCGIDPKVLRGGREGHWGISGVRKQAEKIGAKTRVCNGSPKGTDVELIVPGHTAFHLDARKSIDPLDDRIRFAKREDRITMPG